VAKRENIGVSITDHNAIDGALEAGSLAKELGVSFIPGIELGTKEGKELLFYFKSVDDLKRFYDNEVQDYRTKRMVRISRPMTDFICDSIKKDYNILFVSYPHPYGFAYKNHESNKELTEAMLNFCDGVEIYNAHMSQESNNKAKQLAEKYKKVYTAGSDAHLTSAVGKVLIDLDTDNIVFSEKEVILDKKYKNKPVTTLAKIAVSNFSFSFVKPFKLWFNRQVLAVINKL
jgi:predicted metal-dependent phosphoesterase TrpH